MNDLQTVEQQLLTRRAVKQYDADHKLSQAEVEEILNFANQAPSAWNLQHWRFIAVMSDEAKEKLLPLAYRQGQIKDAAVTFIILGDKAANLNIDTVFDPDVASGSMSPEIKERLAGQINAVYKDDHYAYEAAIMNSTFPAMQIMNIATLKGLGSCAIGGFNRTGIQEVFNIEERYVPALLITVGKTKVEPRSSSRRNVNDVTEYL